MALTVREIITRDLLRRAAAAAPPAEPVAGPEVNDAYIHGDFRGRAPGDVPAWNGSAWAPSRRVSSLESRSYRAPNTIMALGDSITINGWYVNGPVATTFNAQAYLAWVGLFSKGRLRLFVPPGGALPVAATSGYTVQQIIDTHLPTVLAARPGYCVVLAGSNNLPGANASNTAACIAQLRTLYDALRAAGIVPVCCTVPPRADQSSVYQFGYTAVNAFIKRYAADNGLPCADIYTALTDPATVGSYLAGLHNNDQIHPNAAGGKVIGQTIWDAVKDRISPVDPPLPANNVRGPLDTADAFGVFQNSLFLTDTNADGVPDNWAVQAAGGVASLSRNASKGKLLQLTRNAGGTDSAVWNAINSDAIAAGDRMLFVCELDSTVEATAGKASFLVLDNNSAIVVGIDQWDRDIPAGSALAIEFSWPAGFGTRARPIIKAQTTASTVAAWGRVGLLNLTKQGIS